MIFDQSLLHGKVATRRPLSMVLGFLVQCFAIGLLLVIPLIHPEKVRGIMAHTVLIAPLPAQAPPAPAPPQVTQTHRKTIARIPSIDVFRLPAPRKVPTEITMIDDIDMSPAPAPPGVIGGMPCVLPPCGTGNGLPVAELPKAAPPVEPPPAPKPKPVANDKPVRVGGVVQPPILTHQFKPLYPELAKRTRVQGTIRLEAIIGKDGTIRNIQLIGGPPLLVAAAIQAVQQWRYSPTLLNGEPVEVITAIDVTFTLSQ